MYRTASPRVSELGIVSRVRRESEEGQLRAHSVKCESSGLVRKTLIRSTSDQRPASIYSLGKRIQGIRRKRDSPSTGTGARPRPPPTPSWPRPSTSPVLANVRRQLRFQSATRRQRSRLRLFGRQESVLNHATGRFASRVSARSSVVRHQSATTLDMLDGIGIGPRGFSAADWLMDALYISRVLFRFLFVFLPFFVHSHVRRSAFEGSLRAPSA